MKFYAHNAKTTCNLPLWVIKIQQNNPIIIEITSKRAIYNYKKRLFS